MPKFIFSQSDSRFFIFKCPPLFLQDAQRNKNSKIKIERKNATIMWKAGKYALNNLSVFCKQVVVPQTECLVLPKFLC